MLEKILAVLTALVTAIEANTAAQNARAAAPEPKKKKEAAAPVAEVVLPLVSTGNLQPAPVVIIPPSGIDLRAEAKALFNAAAAETPTTPAAVVHPSVLDVRAVAKALLDANNNDDGGLFIRICTRNKITRLTELPEHLRAGVIEEIKAAMPKAPVAPTAEEAI